MASDAKDLDGEEGVPRARHKTENIAMVGSESLESQQDTNDPRAKAANVEPCMAAMENYLLAHFFFIFAASFILGVIFLHSSLTFWSWQVYEESGPYIAPITEVPDALAPEYSHKHGYNGQNAFNDVLSAIISPNMTVSLAR